MPGTNLKTFAASPDFCPECGTVLPLPDKNFKFTRKLACVVCHFDIDATDFSGIQAQSKVSFNTDIKKLSDLKSNIPEGPTVDRKCAKCGHEGMTYATLQTRSADEGQTVFYTCPRCRFKEIENS